MAVAATCAQAQLAVSPEMKAEAERLAASCAGKYAASCFALFDIHEWGRATGWIDHDAAWEALRRAAALEGAVTAQREACRSGDATACDHLGVLYADGIGVERDRVAAVDLLDKACAGGSALACTSLGIIYDSGDSAAKDQAKAAALFETACAGGDAVGCASLGYVHDSCRTVEGLMRVDCRGVPKDEPKAAELYKRACERGSALGCQFLGAMYGAGRGVPEDAAQEAHYYQKACEGGRAQGCDWVSYMYVKGRGVPKDKSRVADLFWRACHGKCDAACDDQAQVCTNLGHIYARGDGVPKDEALAAQLYKRACESGHASGPDCYSLGLMHLKGRVVAKDQARAAELFESACLADHALACFTLAGMYARGEGVEAGAWEAEQHYKRACEHGLKKGCDLVPPPRETVTLGPGTSVRQLLVLLSTPHKGFILGSYELEELHSASVAELVEILSGPPRTVMAWSPSTRNPTREVMLQRNAIERLATRIDEATPELRKMLASRVVDARANALAVLRQGEASFPPRFRPKVLALLKDSSWRVRLSAAAALEKIADPDVTDALLAALARAAVSRGGPERDAELEATVSSLCKNEERDEKILSPVAQVIDEARYGRSVTWEAMLACAPWSKRRTGDVLLGRFWEVLSTTEDDGLANIAGDSLRRGDRDRVLPYLRGALSIKNPKVRGHAVAHLIGIETAELPELRPMLRAALQDPDEWVRRNAASSLAHRADLDPVYAISSCLTLCEQDPVDEVRHDACADVFTVLKDLPADRRAAIFGNRDLDLPARMIRGLSAPAVQGVIVFQTARLREKTGEKIPEARPDVDDVRAWWGQWLPGAPRRQE